MVFGYEVADGIQDIKGDINPELGMACQGGLVDFAEGLDLPMLTKSDSDVDPKLREGIKVTDTCFLVYTSGTTGLPKAGVIKHVKSFLAGAGFVNMFGIKHEATIIKHYTQLDSPHV